MQFTRILATTLICLVSNANSALIQFDFEFFDSSGDLIGDGFYRFDDIGADEVASFASLTNFTWELSVPQYSLSLDSVGNLPAAPNPSQLDFILPTNQGIRLSGPTGFRTLQFEVFSVDPNWNTAGNFIGHSSPSDAFSHGINFSGLSNDVFFFSTDISPAIFEDGTFTAVEVIPEPSTQVFFAFGFLGCFLHRRRTK